MSIFDLKFKIMRNIFVTGIVFAFISLSCQEKTTENGSDKEQKSLSQIDQKDYKELGMKYAKATKSELGKNLKAAIEKGGIIHALDFCNVQAMSITEAMTKEYKAKIARVSDKNRNPSNLASTQERKYIKQFSITISEGGKPEPIVEEDENKVQFYYPLVTNVMCLKCHGDVGEEISHNTYNRVLDLYPEDKAVGYEVNEVRGIWSIEFDKNQ